MRLDLTEFLAHAGRRFPVQLELPSPATLADDLITVVALRVEGEAFVQLGILYLEVAIHVRLEQPCGRCLVPVPGSLELHETFELSIPPGTDSIDLSSEIIDLVISAVDPNVLCRQDCRGLCPVCGADLNQSPEHRCSEPNSDRRTLRDYLS